LINGTAEIEGQLRTWLRDATRVVIVGVGNTIRSDDHVGVRVVEDLRGKVSESIRLIESETVPESFIEEIKGFAPSHVLLIDAAVLGLKPGTVRLLEAEELKTQSSVSTHALPLRLFSEDVKALTGARIAFLLIEPKSTEFGEMLTPEIAGVATILDQILVAVLP